MWTPAFRTYVIDMSPLGSRDMILPGFANRRGLTFQCILASSGSIGPDPTLPDGTGLVFLDTNIVQTLLYKDYGPIISSPWYNMSITSTGKVIIYETYFV